MALVMVNYVSTLFTSAFASFSSGSFPFGLEMTPTGPERGLSEVDLTIFRAGGSGPKYLTQGYGNTPYSYMYVGHWHNGIDIAAQYGAPIYSPTDGLVLAVGNQDNFCWHRGFGKYVAIKDTSNPFVLWYAHLGTISVAPGDTIKKGMTIGNVGASGLETGSHLHLSVFSVSGFSMKSKNGCGPDADGKDVNPIPYLESIQ